VLFYHQVYAFHTVLCQQGTCFIVGSARSPGPCVRSHGELHVPYDGKPRAQGCMIQLKATERLHC